MTELGIGYISIVAQTQGMGRQIQSALDGSQAGADRSGQGLGSKLASGLGKTLKVGVAAAGATAAGALGVSITKGLARLNSIEQAQAKLSGLGNSAGDVAKVMDSALASVKGTAFGLGDAATIAASAVAAGIKPGDELTRTLKLTGDAATIAGVSLTDMGSIFGKVAASNKIQGDVIAQLGDQGIPIVQLLSKELGVTAEETLKLASDGKINFETFQRAMETGLGGAALKAGNTVKGALDNVGAASGRLGATLAGPFFRQAATGFGAITSGVDDLEARVKPVMANFERDLTNKYIPALIAFGGSVKDGFQEFRSSDLVVTSMGTISRVFDSLKSTATTLAPSLKSIWSSLMTASAATGVSSWQVLLATLESIAPILDATLVPALQMTADLMTSNQTAVNALAIGFLAFKTIPALFARVGASAAGMAATTTAAATSVRAVSTATAGMATVAGYGATTLGRFGSQVQALGQRAPAIGAMQTSFLNAAAGADRFGRMAGTAAAATTGIGAAARGVGGGISRLTTALGGPWVVAAAAATAVTIGLVREFGKAERQANALDAVSSTAAASQRRLAEALADTAGEADESVMAAATKGLEDYRAAQLDVIASGPGMFAPLTAGLRDIGGWFSGTAEAGTDALRSQKEIAEAAKETKAQFDELIYSSDELGEKIAGPADAFRSFIASLRSQGLNQAADELARQRGEFDKLQESMRRIGGASLSVTQGLKEIATAAGDGKTKLSGLETVLKGLGILETDTQAALFETAETVRELAEAAAAGVDPVGGLGDALIGLDGQLDPDKSNAKALRESLIDLGADFKNLAASGMGGQEAFSKIEGGLQSLADMYDLPIGKVAEFARQFGILPDEVDIALSVDGGDAAFKTIADVALQMGALADGEPKKILMRVEDEQARKALENLGLGVRVIDETTGEIEVTAKSDIALQALERVRAAVAGLDISIADPAITADATRFRIEEEAVRASLGEMDRSEASPEIDAVIDKFLAGRDVTLAELQKIDLSTAEPDVVLLIEQALAQAKVANDAIDHAARPRFATIDVFADARAANNAIQGAINSGTAVRGQTFATGGRLPTSGPGTERTDGFLAVNGSGAPIARVDAGEWVINGRSSDRYDRELAAINAGTFPKLAGYEDGGRVGVASPKDLLDFVNGSQSQPLTGARYDWAGVKWGDCCLTPETLVWGPGGGKPIAALNPGDQVFSYEDGKMTTRRVVRRWFSKRQETYKVRTRRRAVVGSDNHPFMRLAMIEPSRHITGGARGEQVPAKYDVEWARLDQLQRGDLLVAPKDVSFDQAENRIGDRPVGLLEAWLLGALVGDGSVNDTHIDLCLYGDLRDRAADVFKRLGIHVSMNEKHGLRAYSTQFVRELTKAGFRKRAHEKSVPGCVWGWDSDRQRAFLNGYCDADGHHPADVAHHGERSYASSSRELIEQVRLLHISLGDPVTNVSTNRRVRPIVINGVRVKNARPLHTFAVSAKGDSSDGIAADLRRPGIAEWVAGGEFRLERVIDVVSMGEQDTYDIEVEGSHNFVANGVVVHNSGAMSAIARFAVGLAPFADRFATATQGAALQAMGFLSGLGGLNDLNFGWKNGGPGGGHTAGTLPGGTNVEMGGSYDGGMVGGSVGASSSQFTDHAHLAIGEAFDFSNPGGYASGGRGRTSRTAPEWTDKQQLDLEAAEIAITRAEEARMDVEAQVAEGKKSQADLDMANIKVQQAQQKVTDLQAKKDDVASYIEDGPAPQAPSLSKMFTDSEIERLDAQLAVESANERRNEVYDNPDSSQLELAKADAELFKAQEALKEAGSKKLDSASSSGAPSSWSELLGNFAKDFVSGQVEDALGVFGIPNEMPGIVKAGLMLNDALNERDGSGVTDPGSASQSDIMADSPVLYDPSKGPEQWAPVVEKGLQETGQSLTNTAQALERIAIKSNGDPSNLMGLARDEFMSNRDPSLPNDPMNPLANVVAGLRYKPIRGYHTGGPVVGPSGRDKVAAWLENREFVVNSRAAQAGANPQILQAMNSGAQFGHGGGSGGLSVEDVERMITARPSVTFVVDDMNAALRKWQAEQKAQSGTYSRRG